MQLELSYEHGTRKTNIEHNGAVLMPPTSISWQPVTLAGRRGKWPCLCGTQGLCAETQFAYDWCFNSMDPTQHFSNGRRDARKKEISSSRGPKNRLHVFFFFRGCNLDGSMLGQKSPLEHPKNRYTTPLESNGLPVKVRLFFGWFDFSKKEMLNQPSPKKHLSNFLLVSLSRRFVFF